MVKKILLVLVGALFVGVLVFGAVNRTMALGNYPGVGQRLRYQDTEMGIHRGQEAQGGETWYLPGYGRGRWGEGEANPGKGFGKSRARQGNVTGYAGDSAGKGWWDLQR